MTLTDAELLEMDIQAGYWRAGIINLYPKDSLETMYLADEKYPGTIAGLMHRRHQARKAMARESK